MTSSSPGTRRPSSFSRCAARWARIRPSRSIRGPMPIRRCRTRRRSPARARELKRLGLHPVSLPLGVDIERWLAGGQTPLGRLSRHRHRQDGRRDGCARRGADGSTNIRLETGASSMRLEAAPDGKPIAAIHYRQGGERSASRPKLVILSRRRGQFRRDPAALGQRDGGPRQPLRPGRPQFHEPQFAAMLAIDPRRRNDSVYQKTLSSTTIYLSDGKGGKPLGNVQLLGKIDGDMLKANVKLDAEIRARFHGRPCGRLVPDVRGPARPREPHHGRRQGSSCNGGAPTCSALAGLTKVMRENFRACGYPDRAVAPLRQAHAVASVRHGTMGDDPATRAARPVLPRLRPPRTCSSSMAASCRPRPRSIRR